MRKCPECSVHRFPEEVDAHGICRPCVRKRQLVSRVVLSQGGRLSLEDLQKRIKERDRRLRAYNAAVMRRVHRAACLPPSGAVTDQGRESKGAQVVCSDLDPTISTLAGSLDGCGAHGNG